MTSVERPKFYQQRLPSKGIQNIKVRFRDSTLPSRLPMQGLAAAWRRMWAEREKDKSANTKIVVQIGFCDHEHTSEVLINDYPNLSQRIHIER